MYQAIQLILRLSLGKLAALGKRARQVFPLHVELLHAGGLMPDSFLPNPFLEPRVAVGEFRIGANETLNHSKTVCYLRRECRGREINRF